MSQQAIYSTLVCLQPLLLPIMSALSARGLLQGRRTGPSTGMASWDSGSLWCPLQDLVIARMGLNFLNDFDPVPAPPPLACRSLHEYVRSADDEALMSQTCICLCSHSCELESAPVCCPAHTTTPCMFTRERQQVTWRGYQ